MGSRRESIERLRRIPDTVQPGQPYVVEAFRPEDGEGVAELFYRTYGDAYPLDIYYDPRAVREAVAAGALHPVVARLPDGQAAGFACLYKSSPPFSGLLEIGLGMVHPAYRGSFILFHLYNALNVLMDSLPELSAVFGEAVCDTIITQHATSLFGFKECAMELDLMPGAGDGRVACLMMFRNLRDARRKLFVPNFRAREVEALATRLNLDREFVPSRMTPSPGDATRLGAERFDFAKLLRGHLFQAGGDFQDRLAEEERAAREAGCRRFQWFLNLADPCAGSVVDWLRDRGYGLAGLAPRWFDDDALLMDKLLDPPNLPGIHLYSDQARELLAMALAERAFG